MVEEAILGMGRCDTPCRPTTQGIPEGVPPGGVTSGPSASPDRDGLSVATGNFDAYHPTLGCNYLPRSRNTAVGPRILDAFVTSPFWPMRCARDEPAEELVGMCDDPPTLSLSLPPQIYSFLFALSLSLFLSLQYVDTIQENFFL